MGLDSFKRPVSRVPRTTGREEWGLFGPQPGTEFLNLISGRIAHQTRHRLETPQLPENILGSYTYSSGYGYSQDDPYMTKPEEYRFYQLDHEKPEPALAQMLRIALNRSERSVIKCANLHYMQALNRSLWTITREEFLPHGSGDDDAADQPIWLTLDDDNPNNASTIFLLEGVGHQRLEQFRLCVVLIPLDQLILDAAFDLWRSLQGGNRFWWVRNGKSWQKIIDPMSPA